MFSIDVEMASTSPQQCSDWLFCCTWRFCLRATHRPDRLTHLESFRENPCNKALYTVFDRTQENNRPPESCPSAILVHWLILTSIRAVRWRQVKHSYWLHPSNILIWHWVNYLCNHHLVHNPYRSSQYVNHRTTWNTTNNSLALCVLCQLHHVLCAILLRCRLRQCKQRLSWVSNVAPIMLSGQGSAVIQHGWSDLAC